MKTAAIIILIILSIFILLVCVLGVVLAIFVAKPKYHSNEDCIGYAKSSGCEDKYIYNKHKEYIIESFDKYELHASLLKCGENTNKYVILSHGYTVCKITSLQHVKMYHNLGYNVIIYDNRGHGDNKRGQCCTLGKTESKDLICVIDDTYKRYGKDIYLGLQGESMGSGLEIMALKYKPQVHFIVNDCGYAKLKNVLKFKIVREFHLPPFLVDVASVFSKILFNFSYNEIRPILNLKDNYIPICFITGDRDMFVPARDSISMYIETKGYKELHLFEGVDHAECRKNDSDRYDKIVASFLEKVSMNEKGE